LGIGASSTRLPGQANQSFCTRRMIASSSDWEQRLCAGMERSKNGVYSMKLADKWWEEIKKRYSHIEMVGVKSSLD
jgi:hypothetical protein